VWSHDEERLEQLATKLLATTAQEPAAADDRSMALETTEHEQLSGNTNSPLSAAIVSSGDVMSGSARAERAVARQLRSEIEQDDRAEDDGFSSSKRSRRKPPRPTAAQVRRCVSPLPPLAHSRSPRAHTVTCGVTWRHVAYNWRDVLAQCRPRRCSRRSVAEARLYDCRLSGGYRS
jgi:hypothetical protein